MSLSSPFDEKLYIRPDDLSEIHLGVDNFLKDRVLQPDLTEQRHVVGRGQVVLVVEAVWVGVLGVVEAELFAEHVHLHDKKQVALTLII